MSLHVCFCELVRFFVEGAPNLKLCLRQWTDGSEAQRQGAASADVCCSGCEGGGMQADTGT